MFTNDDWNDKMEEVGVMPVRQPMSETFPDLHPNVSEAPPLQAIAGRLLSVDPRENHVSKEAWRSRIPIDSEG